MIFKEGKVYELIVIGSNDSFLLEVVGVYVIFGNSGNYNKLYFVKEVIFLDGKKKSFKLKEYCVM